MESGFRAVSTRQIADACGITQPALYHHFKNKKAIYVEVIRTILLETETELQKICRQDASLTDRLTGIFVYFMSHHQYDIGQMFHDLIRELDKDTAALIQGWWSKSFLDPVVSLIKDAVEKNELKQLDAWQTNETELAFLILTFIQSAMNHTQFQGMSEAEQQKEIARKANLFVGVVLTGIEQ